MKTHLAIYEWGATTASYKIDGLVATGSVWDDCVTALNIANYRPQLFPNETIRAPGAWSSPGTNIGSQAASTGFGPGVLASPHVHGGRGVGHRAAIGYKITPANIQPGHVYQFMKIYIGQFS